MAKRTKTTTATTTATSEPKAKATPKVADMSASEIRAIVAALEFDHEGIGKGDGNTTGVTTGQKLTHFLNGLYWACYSEGWTDPVMMAVVRAEFPNRAVIQSMGAYRSYYNAGKHGHGVPDDDGRIVAPDEPLPRFS